MALRYVIDTNISLRMTNPALQHHELCRSAVVKLNSEGCGLHYTLQNAAEFWNTCTRPTDRNGFGLTPAQAALVWGDIEELFTLLPDDANVYRVWRDLVRTQDVRGVQVHDAKLAASMLANGIPRILTLNTVDFDRYPGIEAIHPAKV